MPLSRPSEDSAIGNGSRSNALLALLARRTTLAAEMEELSVSQPIADQLPYLSMSQSRSSFRSLRSSCPTRPDVSDIQQVSSLADGRAKRCLACTHTSSQHSGFHSPRSHTLLRQATLRQDLVLTLLVRSHTSRPLMLVQQTYRQDAQPFYGQIETMRGRQKARQAIGRHLLLAM